MENTEKNAFDFYSKSEKKSVQAIMVDYAKEINDLAEFLIWYRNVIGFDVNGAADIDVIKEYFKTQKTK